MTEIARIHDDFDHRVARRQFLQFGHRFILRVVVDEDHLELVFRQVSNCGLDLCVEFVDIVFLVVARGDYTQERAFGHY